MSYRGAGEDAGDRPALMRPRDVEGNVTTTPSTT